MTIEPMHCDRCGKPHAGKAGTSAAGCAGHRRDGGPCGNDAMVGQRVCRMHGGSSPQALAAAEQRQLDAAAEAVVVNMLWPGLRSAEPVKDPVASLERLAGALEQLVDQAGARVAGLHNVAGGKDLTSLRAEVTLLERALGHLRGVLVDMARLGIAERHVQLEQERANVVTAAFLAALEVGGLLPEVRSLMVERFTEGLRSIVPGEVVA